MKQLQLLFIFLCFAFLAKAQTYPVTVVPTIKQPAPIYFSNYADPSVINGPLQVQIILNDLSISNREIRLKTYFEGNGISFQSNAIVNGASPLFLEGGIPLVLNASEIAPYYEFTNTTGISANVYGQPIPEGSYEFCYEVYDAISGNRISQKTCATTYIFQNEPPFLVYPQNRAGIQEQNPQNIVFQWTPRHINVSNVEYELTLVEIWDNNIDPQAAFLSSRPVFTTTTRNTTYIYGPTDPLLLSNKRYAWRVKAKALQGAEEVGVFKNNGNSEIFSFILSTPCKTPQNVTHEVKGMREANIYWDDFTTDISEFTVRYREKGEGNQWFSSRSTANWVTLWDLRPGTVYEYQVAKKCELVDSDYSTIKSFTTFIAEDESGLYNCGIPPAIDIATQEPLAELKKGDVFKAGDFPVKVQEVSGNNGRFTGKGYVTIPYLKSVKVAVEFTNVFVNTDSQLAEGMVITKYDPSMKNILDVDEAVNDVKETIAAVKDVVSEAESLIEDVFNNDDEDEENAPPIDPEIIEEVAGIDKQDDDTVVDNNTSTQGGIADVENSNELDVGGSGQNSNGNENTTSSSNNSPGGSDAVSNEVVIDYNGNEYRNNDVIEVPYVAGQSHYAFFLKNYPEGAQLKWNVLYVGSDYTDRYAQNDTNLDNLGIDMGNVSMLDIVAHYNDKNIKIRLKRELQDFKLKELYAAPPQKNSKEKRKRVARSGETLYLQKSSTPFNKAQRKVDFSILLSEKLSKSEISSRDIEWHYENPNSEHGLEKNNGDKDIHLNLTEQDENYTVLVKAGKPDLIEKSVDIVWFDGKERSWSFMPPAVSQVLTKNFKEVKDGLEFTDKVLPMTGINFTVDDVLINGSEGNTEDEESRLYYLEQKGNVSGGLKIESKEIYINVPALVALSRVGVVDIGPYIKFGLSITAEGGVERRKYVEKDTFTENEMYFELKAAGCIDIGAKVELLVAQNLVNFLVDFKATGCLAGSGNYNFDTNFLRAKFYVPPVVLSGEIDISTKGTLKFELIKWSKSISITDEFKISEIEKQF